jgi:hypothetical protein
MISMLGTNGSFEANDKLLNSVLRRRNRNARMWYGACFSKYKHKLKAIENSNYYELNPNWGWVWRANRLPEKMKCKQAIYTANLNWVLNCEINSAENLYLQRIMIKHGQYRIN